MYVYLLPGSEFHDKLREYRSDVDSTLMYVTFDYTSSVPDTALEWDQVDVSSAGDNHVQACLSEDGTELYVHSIFDIRVRDCQMMFYRMSRLVRVELTNFVTCDCTSFRRMYMNCSSLPYVDMCGLSAPRVEDFTEMFSAQHSPSVLNAQSAEHCTMLSWRRPWNSSPASTSAKDCASAPPSRFMRLRHLALSPTEIMPARHLHFRLCSQLDVSQRISFIGHLPSRIATESIVPAVLFFIRAGDIIP